jgi:hypothetical protein
VVLFSNWKCVVTDVEIVEARIAAVQREDRQQGISLSSRVSIDTGGLTCLPLRLATVGGEMVLLEFRGVQAVYEVV